MAESPREVSCVVGLGNPGEEYRFTRHNIGFQVVDALAARWKVDIRRTEFRALTGEGFLGRSMVLLMKPQTFMNASGRSVADAFASHGLSPDRLIAVYDDLDLPLGRLCVRADGGAGGHRGVASLIEELGTSAFARVRVGIGHPREAGQESSGEKVIDHVLSPFRPAEAEAVVEATGRAADAVESILGVGLARTMETFNRR
ncbi:MAG: aminoacyl-tRNA hydrolase [Candidatus Binatia bacterium]